MDSQASAKAQEEYDSNPELRELLTKASESKTVKRTRRESK